jgi:hypothetical protein
MPYYTPSTPAIERSPPAPNSTPKDAENPRREPHLSDLSSLSEAPLPRDIGEALSATPDSRKDRTPPICPSVLSVRG